MRLKWLSVVFLLALLVSPAFAQLSENFTLNFPQGNGTTTVITFQSVQDQNLQNLIGGSIVAIVAVLFLIVLYRRYKG
jgi:type II secretory pathway component PulF